MNDDTKLNTSIEILNLIGEIYHSILTPERFVEVLEMWEETVTANGKVPQEAIDLLEEQLVNAVPLLENSFKNTVNQGDLVQKLNEETNPCLLITTDKIVMGANKLGREIFNFQDGDRIDSSLMENDDQAKLNEMLRASMNSDNSDSFDIFNLAYRNHKGAIEQKLVGSRTVQASYSKISFIIISAVGIHLSEKKQTKSFICIFAY